MMLKLDAAAYTHIGKVRKNNEDNFYLFGKYRSSVETSVQKVHRRKHAGRALAAVCDGMGGEEAGEIASLVAVKELKPLGLPKLREDIAGQVTRMNEAVCRERTIRGDKHMGTTFVGLYFADNHVLCCNVGDSRAYLFRDNRLQQLSEDHNEARRQVSLGILTEEQARESKSRHCLTQHIGLFPKELVIAPFYSELISLKTGDIFLLCSDGITDMITDSELAALFSHNKKAKKYVQDLINIVIKKGARDNATAVVVCVK